MARDQAKDAKYLYDDRSAVYDDSWHPRFARHIVELIRPRPGEHVLDLACGTGLVSYPASEAVGPSGRVIGVDISGGMLAQAEKKKQDHPLQNVQFYEHSITSLDDLEAIAGQKFDVITCASAFVLLKKPDEALRHWVHYLKPGGRLITDATHPRSQLAHITLERVGQTLGKPVPTYRLPFQSSKDLRTMMEAAGLEKVDVKLVAQLGRADERQDLDAYLCDEDRPVIARTYGVADAEEVFERLIGTRFGEALAQPGTRESAKGLFNAEWAKLGDDRGLIAEVDGVYVGTGHKSGRL